MNSNLKEEEKEEVSFHFSLLALLLLPRRNTHTVMYAHPQSCSETKRPDRERKKPMEREIQKGQRERRQVEAQ